jgi:phosphoenolpyruvate carboxylase
MNELRSPAEDELRADVKLLGNVLGETIQERSGADALALVEGLRQAAIALRSGKFAGGRDAFHARLAALDLGAIERVAHAFTEYFHLINAAEEQHRIRVLRRRDRPGAPPDGSILAAVAGLKKAGATPSDVRALLGRLFIMPVLTAHPTEARRRTVLDHLDQVSRALDRLDDPRSGSRERHRVLELLREAVVALDTTEESRAARPTPLDEVRSGLLVFERTLLDVTPTIYRELEAGLAAEFPGESFVVGPFLQWGTWIGGDRDGNPHVTADVTRAALERQRAVAIARHEQDVLALGRELSVSQRRLPPTPAAQELLASLATERERLPEVAARTRRSGGEPLREKLTFMHARLEAARTRGDASYADAAAYLDDLSLIERFLEGHGLARLARGRLRDARRRAEVFGFHLASMDLRQHSAVHERASAELLARGGVSGYASLDEEGRVRLLGRLLERADLGLSRERPGLSAETRELLATLEVVGRARRDAGPAACERYVVSFTNAPSDLLEVLFLSRVAGLAPDELRPVPLLEQLEDLERAETFARRMFDLEPIRVALGGELEVMIGYSDSGKQAGYVASAVALGRAQEALARVAEERAHVLTVFHGRGGAIGRGGGPASRAIRAQPPRALRGRLRMTEQGETISARYARSEIARRDLEQMVNAVLLAWTVEREVLEPDRVRARDETLERAARAARASYERVIEDEERLASYTVAATPILEVAEMPIASRPTSRRAGLAFEALRAIPWVFSWNQSRHGIPGWFGLGSALDAIATAEGPLRARELYESWPFFRALVDNAQLALVRADLDVAEHYSRLAEPHARGVFELIRVEHARTVARILEVTQKSELVADWPTILRTVKLRNPYVDVLSHAQIELLGRIQRTHDLAERAHLREALFVTINGIAAGLQTVG